MNAYQVDTTIQLNVAFFNTALNLPADPTAVALFVEDPDGNVSEVPGSQISRTGVGVYISEFMPTEPGEWTYKWQGTGNVAATSRDTRFFVQASDLVD